MFIVANFLSAVAQVLDVLLNIYWWILLIRALVSWVNPDPYNPIIIFLQRATEPVLEPLRRLVPPERVGGIDLSPLLAMLAIIFIRAFLVQSLLEIAARLR
jgi:YggT family protein